MKKSDINPMPQYFDKYINLVSDIELLQAFEESVSQLDSLNINLLIELREKRYAHNKWTVNEIVQHITDIERLLCCGVLRFARNESDYIISFNENEIAKASKANNKNIVDLIDELKIVRLATISLYKGFDSEDLFKTGINWKYPINILAMGFNIIGHQRHHFKIIEDRYYSLLNL